GGGRPGRGRVGGARRRLNGPAGRTCPRVAAPARLGRSPPRRTAMRHPARAFRQYAHIALLLLSAILLAGCASLSRRDPLQVDVAGIEPLPGEGLELRMAVKLRIRNPNDRPLVYDGAALALELNGL